MKSIRDCTISGNLVRKPISLKTKNGKDLTYFTLACNFTSASGEKKVTYVELEAWDKMALYCAKHLEKGNFISTKSTLRQESWEKNGVYNHKTHLSVYEVNNISLQNKIIEQDFPDLKKAG